MAAALPSPAARACRSRAGAAGVIAETWPVACVLPVGAGGGGPAVGGAFADPARPSHLRCRAARGQQDPADRGPLPRRPARVPARRPAPPPPPPATRPAQPARRPRPSWVRSRRRSFSVSPPAIPYGIRANASARHSARTGQPAHTAFAAATCTARTGPRSAAGKNNSGSTPRHAARARHPRPGPARPRGRLAARVLRCHAQLLLMFVLLVLDLLVFGATWVRVGRPGPRGAAGRFTPPPYGVPARPARLAVQGSPPGLSRSDAKRP